MASNFSRDLSGHCIGCGDFAVLANPMEPCCIPCYARYVIPVPVSQQQFGVADGRWKDRKGYPRRGKVQFMKKVIEDSDM